MGRSLRRWAWPGVVAMAFGCGSPNPVVDGSARPDATDAPLLHDVVSSDVGMDVVEEVASTDAADAGDASAPSDSHPIVDAEAGPPSGSNVVTLIVDDGPNHLGTTDTPYISVTFCRPGTAACQTIDHIEVDTGSSGLRVIASVLDPSLSLPANVAPSGGTLVECMQFADGYSWGSIATADIEVGGEIATGVAVEVIGDPAFPTIPRACARSGARSDTVATFGANGIIGIGTDVSDCGSDCADPASPLSGAYYACTAGSCSVEVVPIAQQVLNPVPLFPSHNNGSMIQLPALGEMGAVSATGYLVFGIGTRANNGLGAATVLSATVDGYFTTMYAGQSMPNSFIDSGSSGYYFADSTIVGCTGANQGFDCPATTVSLSAQNVGVSGATSDVTFRVANADTLFASTGFAAFDDLGGSSTSDSFDWGLPFFFGRSVFTAITGASTPGGTGPYYAY